MSMRGFAVFVLLSIAAVSMHGEGQRRAAYEEKWNAELQQLDQIHAEIKVIRQDVEELKLQQEGESTHTSRGVDRTAVVTAYTWTGNQTASGTWPREGRTIAGPRWVPFGTRVYVDGIGWRIIEDRTHERFDGRWDVYMESRDACLAWGIQQRAVVIE